MNILEFIKKHFTSLEINTTKSYLILANIILTVFAIWFSNVGLLPFKNAGDFGFFLILVLVLVLYRPGWAFVFFIGSIALENVNLAPVSLGLALRPYQLFGAMTLLAVLLQFLAKRQVVVFPKLKWYDAMPIFFALGGFLSGLAAINKGSSLKQALIAASFVALYFLVRMYIQSMTDLKRIAPFFLSSGVVIVFYAIWQNIRFIQGAASFEVMPGRPNGTFTEPDWLGIYLVFLVGAALTMIFNFNRNGSKKNMLLVSGYGLLVAIFLALILTVSRSAWLGALFVVLVFLKFALLENYEELMDKSRNSWQQLINILKMKQWQWQKAGKQLFFLIVTLGLALLLAVPLTRFQLGSRAVSTGGLQKITVACKSSADNVVPQKILNVGELADYGCWHINLEDIEKEKTLGNLVIEVDRPDPNVNIRAEIYRKSWAQIKQYPFLGIGWGSISTILGTDERGAGLNASNIFLETWLGSGLIGILSLIVLLGYLLVVSIRAFLVKASRPKDLTMLAFVMLGWAAVVIPNLFNSGIFLGFFWVYLGVAVGLFDEKSNV